VEPILQPSDVYDIVREAVLPTATTSDRFGIEAEWFPLYRSHLGRATIGETAPLLRRTDALRERAGDNPSFVNEVGGTVTFEPGGQIEHSGVAHATIPHAFGELATTHRVLTSALERDDIMLVPAGVDHWNDVGKVDQQLVGPRYPTMAAYFDARHAGAESTGRLMMRHTASLQINLDAGHDTLTERWVLANLLSPLLTASFSTSPGDNTHSRRAAIWQRLDSTRTGFPDLLDPDEDIVENLTRRALESDVLVVIRPDQAIQGRRGWTLADWLRDPDATAGVPTADDVTHHLTTLFPEVRLRGGVLELRAIDGLPGRWCTLPAVLLAGALYDTGARQRLLDVTLGTDPAEMWSKAAQRGLADPDISAMARTVWPIALEGARRLGTATTGDLSPAAEFVQQRLSPGRTFADDIRSRLTDDPDGTAFWLANG
jgi:glutamate--cysteine ligase